MLRNLSNTWRQGVPRLARQHARKICLFLIRRGDMVEDSMSKWLCHLHHTQQASGTSQCPTRAQVSYGYQSTTRRFPPGSVYASDSERNMRSWPLYAGHPRSRKLVKRVRSLGKLLYRPTERCRGPYQLAHQACVKERPQFARIQASLLVLPEI